MGARTLLSRVDRRLSLAKHSLPLEVALPGGHWRPTIRRPTRVRLDGYGYGYELRATGILGRWRLYEDAPDAQGLSELTDTAVEFDTAWTLLCERCEAVRGLATATVETEQARQTA